MELATTDQSASKHFYSAILGWTVNDIPIGPSDFYTMFLLNGRTAASACTMLADERALGIPPHWNLYVCVSSADDIAKKAPQLGGKVLVPAFDVMEVGRMAVLQDPTGAMFSIWQPKTHIGVSVINEAGAFCWADLMTPDLARAKAFYEPLFGWKFEARPQDSSGYLQIKNGAKAIGGIPPAGQRDPNIPPHWLINFAVADAGRTTAQATALGAGVIVPLTILEGVGRFSVIADPQGAVLALFQPEARG